MQQSGATNLFVQIVGAAALLLFARLAFDLLAVASYLHLVYTDDSGKQYYARGGPSVTSRIEAKSGEYGPGTPDFPTSTNPSETFNSWPKQVVASGSDADLNAKRRAFGMCK